jgi:hypothetical protein
MEALRLDGNAAAGTLQQVFAAEVTTAMGTCAACGATDAVGAVHVYMAAGVVLRCRHCDAVLMRIVQGPTRMWIDLSGLRMLEVPL